MKIRVDGRPLYIRAEESLSELIVRQYQPGDKLLPEPTLTQHPAISHSTLREALRTFEEQGLITGRQGMGTFANMPCQAIDSDPETLVRPDTLARDTGLPCTTGNGPSNRCWQVNTQPTSWAQHTEPL